MWRSKEHRLQTASLAVRHTPAALDAKQRKRYAKFHGKVAKEFARMTTAVT